MVVLRTYYDGADDDKKLHGWLEEIDPYDWDLLLGNPDDRWWRVLDDAELFDIHPEGWESVYNVLPELATTYLDRSFNHGDMEDMKDYATHWEDNLGPVEDDYEDAVAQVAAVGYLLLVADQQAFEEEEFGHIFRDRKGNVVRQSSIKAADIDGLEIRSIRKSVTESGYWAGAAVRKKYKNRGKIMRAVLPVVMKSE